MIFGRNSLAAVVCLVDLGWSIPLTVRMIDSGGITWHPAGKTQSTCGPSTFADAPNIDAADWRECAGLYASWSSTNGTFSLGDLDANGFTPILQTEGCTLGVKPANSSQKPFTIGDKDVKELLYTSLQQFSRGTDLSVTGTVKCAAGSDSKGDVLWRISKS